jgi:zinc/manganese transport system substrate-binding protein
MKSLHIFVLAALIPVATLARLNVVATTADFGSIAAEIGGDRTEVTTLARPTEDPHFVDARPSFIAKLNRADVLVEGGAELEIGWLPPLLEGARNPKLSYGAPGHVACAGGVDMLEVPASLDRSKGDIHAAGNPHFMVDPENGKIAAGHICEALCKLDAASCDYFRENLAKFNAKVDAKMAEWQGVLSPYRGRQLIAYHNTWPYFGRRFGVNIDLFLEPKPGIPPTPANLASVMSKMTTDHISVILVEPYQNRKTAERVAAETGATVVDVAQFPDGVRGADDGYVGLIDYLVNSLAHALAGSKQP